MLVVIEIDLIDVRPLLPLSSIREDSARRTDLGS